MFEDIRQLSTEFILTRNRPYQRYLIADQWPKHRFLMILGERGVGKTTTLIQGLLKDADGDPYSELILYVQADHFLMQQTTLYEVAEYFHQMGVKAIAFDEIHKYPDWSLELKSIYDTFPKLKIYASGSSALAIYRGTHDLSRRVLVKYMYGLSFREFLCLKYEQTLVALELEEILNNHVELARSILQIIESQHFKILPLFREYLQYGYYPYFLEEESTTEYLLLVEQHIHATLESDLASIFPSLTGHSIKKLKQLLSYIAGSVPFTPNWQKIKQAIGVSDDRTIKNYFKYLQDSMIITYLSQGTTKMSALEVNEKILLSNPNLFYALTYREVEIGSLRESFFCNQLKVAHNLSLPKQGDFIVDKEWVFEVGGKKKDRRQITSEKKAYVVADDIETGVGSKIPLWLFGFLY